MTAEQVARDHYADRKRLSSTLGKLIKRLWSGIDPADLDGEWAQAVPSLILGLTGAQQVAAGQADGYVAAALDGQGLDSGSDDELDPSAFAGIASDGRPLDGLLRNPITVVKAGIAGGATVDQAMAAGFANLDMIVRTQLADAGRAADQVALVSRPDAAGYVRMLVGSSCSRCAILAGRWYRWNAGFNRHPRCDCIGVPGRESTAGDVAMDPRAYFDSLSPAEQDKVFTKAGAEAIRDGADMNRVVNARRGMYQAGDLSLTTEATTRRGIGRPVRLMPEQIYKLAGNDRDEALRLLRANGYLVGKPAIVKPAPLVVVETPAPRPAKAAPKPVAAVPPVAPKPRPAPKPAEVKAAEASYSDRRKAAAAGDDALAAPKYSLVRTNTHARPGRREGLTVNQREALRDYQSSTDYRLINGHFHDLAKGLDPKSFPKTLEQIGHIDAAMAGSPLDRDVVLWRGFRKIKRTFGDAADGDLTGAEWTEPAYLSTTSAERVTKDFAHSHNGSVIMRILVPKGTKGVQISKERDDNGFPDEAEILLDRGAKLRVVADYGLSGSIRRIDVEVIG